VARQLAGRAVGAGRVVRLPAGAGVACEVSMLALAARDAEVFGRAVVVGSNRIDAAPGYGRTGGVDDERASDIWVTADRRHERSSTRAAWRRQSVDANIRRVGQRSPVADGSNRRRVSPGPLVLLRLPRKRRPRSS